MFDYDPSSYAIGDPIFIGNLGGWGPGSFNRYTVTKKTPSGQITATLNAHTIRISARGSVIGEGQWSRKQVISEERARDIAAANREEAAWHQIRKAAEYIDKAARNKSDKMLGEAQAALAQAIEARRAATTEIGAVADESAVPTGCAQPSSGDTSNE